MTEFKPTKKTAQDFNNGIKYVDGYGDEIGDVLQAESINNVIEGVLYTQGLGINTPDATLANQVGTPYVKIITATDGSARLKFENLKGETGRAAAVKSSINYYANSSSGIYIPSEGWSNLPNPIKGQYMWVRTIITWNDDEQTLIHSVSYIAKDGDPADASKYVTTNTEQQITGKKTFTNSVMVGASSIGANGDIEGKRIKISASSTLNSIATKIAVIDSSGYICWRSPSQILLDGGIITPELVFNSSISSIGSYNFLKDISIYDILYWECYRTNDPVYTSYAIPVAEWQKKDSDYKFEMAPSASTDVWITVYPLNNTSFRLHGINKCTLSRVWGMRVRK